MDKKSKILIAILITALVISIGYTFWKTVVQGDFEVRTDIPVKE